VHLAGRRLGALGLIRALDAEQQLRTIDAVVPFGAQARLLLALVPSTLRQQVAGVEAGSDPLGACARLRAVLTPAPQFTSDGAATARLADPAALGGN